MTGGQGSCGTGGAESRCRVCSAEVVLVSEICGSGDELIWEGCGVNKAQLNA